MNILILYNATQTYTNNVYDHVKSFSSYSKNNVFYAHVDSASELNVDFRRFDALVIHYSVRVVFEQINDVVRKRIKAYAGIKCLFIQDEHEYHNRACAAIVDMGVDFVFTCVPGDRVGEVYPEAAFKGTKFISCLTGYVSDLQMSQFNDFNPPSQRSILVGYRGRPLPIRYGEMGQDKIRIGQLFKNYCVANEIKADISWMEEDRIYGDDWYAFIGNCRGMLGTESGANVFDWDGKLLECIAEWRKINPDEDDGSLYDAIIKPNDLHGLMNQISPRIFETIVARTILVLFEGGYSGVIEPGVHYLAVKKDGSNIAEVINLLSNNDYIDAMAERAYCDIIASGKFTYEKFVSDFDRALSLGKMCTNVCDQSVLENFGFEYVHPISCVPIRASLDKYKIQSSDVVTAAPLRASTPVILTDTSWSAIRRSTGYKNLVLRFAIYLWLKLPQPSREFLKPRIKRLMKIDT